MKKILTILFVVCNALAFAQGGAMADLKFEEAETAFSNNDYKNTIAKLDEFDKLFGSVTAKSLYLRIVSQDKLFEHLFLRGVIGANIINEEKGILITNIIQDRGAFMAGLKVNDKILKLNNKEIKNINEFIEIISHKDGGDIVELQIERANEIKNIKVEVRETDTRIEEKLYSKESNFDQLVSLRKNASSYLKAMESEGLDDKYREVYAISEKLKQYPKDKAEWLKEKQRIEDEKIAKEKAEKQKVEELENYYREIATKIDAWEYIREIKIGENLLELKKQYPEIYKNVNKKGDDVKVDWLNLRKDMLIQFWVKNGLIDGYVFYVGEGSSTLDNLKQQLQTAFGMSLKYEIRKTAYTTDYMIDSPNSTCKIIINISSGAQSITITKQKK
jgi:hypothetical protein